MKHNHIFSCLFISLYVICSGCSIPAMILNHENQLNKTYDTKGSMKISMFEDQRPDEERIEHETVVNSLSPQIWSGSTSPKMMLFFQNTLIEEANRTNIFLVNDQAELELSGYITSMKVDRKVTIWRYLAPITMVTGILLSDLPDLHTKPGTQTKESNMTPALIGIAGGFFMSFLDYPVLTATVEFYSTLKLNGIVIFEKDIKHVKENSYSAMAVEWGWQEVSDEASRVLDQAITESIKTLFDEIAHELE